MQNKKYLLLAAIVLQLFILSGIYAKAHLPLWIGQEIRVKTYPVDPRSLFRGNYARLNYEFSRFHIHGDEAWQEVRVGERVYVSLQASEAGFYERSAVSLIAPEQGLYIEGRISSVSKGGGVSRGINAKYGIEAYFAPKQEALRLEDELRSGAVAVLMVTGSGQVALKAVEPRPDKSKPSQ